MTHQNFCYLFSLHTDFYKIQNGIRVKQKQRFYSNNQTLKTHIFRSKKYKDNPAGASHSKASVKSKTSQRSQASAKLSIPNLFKTFGGGKDPVKEHMLEEELQKILEEIAAAELDKPKKKKEKTIKPAMEYYFKKLILSTYRCLYVLYVLGSVQS